jgi:acetylornithine deacetylase
LVELLRELIDIPSTTGQETAVLERLEGELSQRGFRVERQPVAEGRWNLLARPSDGLRLLFCTHVDVVPPHIPSHLEGGRVYGRGACDTKGGLVAMLEAADRLDPDRRFAGFLLVVGEEVDHIGAVTARALDVHPEAIVLCEPTTGNLVTGQKGMLKVTLTSRGVAAHSAHPELGQDALGPLLDTLQRLRAATYDRHAVLGETTVNIGVLEAGVAANVIPAEAHAELMYRIAVDEHRLLDQVKAMVAPGVELEVESVNPPITLNSVAGFPTESIAFNTDAHYLSELGPVYLMGPGDIRVAHGDEEHIAIEDMVRGVDDYVRLVRALLGE